jgi:hypothetical protein
LSCSFYSLGLSLDIGLVIRRLERIIHAREALGNPCQSL